MSALRDLRFAVPETEAWVDDVMHRLGWHDREPAIDAEEAAVLAALAARLPAGELEGAKAATPQPLHHLWPN